MYRIATLHKPFSFCNLSSRLLLAIVFIFSSLGCTNNTKNKEDNKGQTTATPSALNKKWKEHLKQAKQFVKEHYYNMRFCYMIDLSITSGKKRFFVVNLEKETILFSGLVAHGSCNTDGLAMARYSNEIGSGCSSLGKYKIGYKYTGRFGPAYKLYGLENSNSNAFDRAVVLHKYECVPDFEMIEAGICNSLGCPMVSPKFFSRLEKIIDASKKLFKILVLEVV